MQHHLKTRRIVGIRGSRAKSRMGVGQVRAAKRRLVHSRSRNAQVMIISARRVGAANTLKVVVRAVSAKTAEILR